MNLQSWLRPAWHIVRAASVPVTLLLVLITCTPVLRFWIGLLTGPWTNANSDVLIVLAGGITDAGMVAESSYWRSVYAVWAWRDGKFREIVISGDKSITEPMREFLLYRGIPASAVRLEPRSRSTRENAINTAQLLQATPGRKVLLTSDYHTYRARRAFDKAGLQVSTLPFADAGKRMNQWRGRWAVFWDLTEETVKIAYYWAHGWI